MSTLIDENTKSQCEQILKYLKTGKGITKPVALRLCNCFNLPARIFDIRKDYKVKTVTIRLRNKKRVGQYFLIKKLKSK